MAKPNSNSSKRKARVSGFDYELASKSMFTSGTFTEMDSNFDIIDSPPLLYRENMSEVNVELTDHYTEADATESIITIPSQECWI